MTKRVGVLAVQGAFIEHRRALEKLGCECVELRKRADIGSLDALVLPGGESTTQGKLLRELEMMEPLRDAIVSGVPTLATCAGMILLSERIANDDNVYFGTLPVVVRRNAYGRQLGSFQRPLELAGIGEVDAVFIRAPYIESVGDGVEVLAEVDGKIVAVKYGKQLALAFHPELCEDLSVHRAFCEL